MAYDRFTYPSSHTTTLPHPTYPIPHTSSLPLIPHPSPFLLLLQPSSSTPHIPSLTSPPSSLTPPPSSLISHTSSLTPAPSSLLPHPSSVIPHHCALTLSPSSLAKFSQFRETLNQTLGNIFAILQKKEMIFLKMFKNKKIIFKEHIVHQI